MDKRSIFLVVGVTISVMVALFGFEYIREAFYQFKGNSVAHQIQNVTLNGKRIRTEVVSSPEDVKQGLSDRPSMDRDRGMLFELGYRDIHPFWMNRMHFPLDIIWIDGDTVVEIAKDLPPPKFGQVPVTYTPRAVADRVLEVNAGVVDETGLNVGDVIGGLTSAQK